MRALALCVLLLAPAAARAEPISALAFILQASVQIGAFVVSVKSIILVGLYVYGSTRARRKARSAQAKARAEYNANLQDRTVTALQALPPWRVIPGRAVTGGDVHGIFNSDGIGTRGNANQAFDVFTRPDAVKHLVIVFADHESHAIHEIYIDGVPLGPLDAAGRVTQGEFYRQTEEIRKVQIPGGGSITVSPPVVALLGATRVFNGLSNPTKNELANVSLSSGNTVITGPAGVFVTYKVDATASSVRVQKHLGSPGDASADSFLVNALGGAALSTQFSTASTLEGWTASGATATVAGGVLSLVSTGTDPIIRQGSLSFSGNTYRTVRARIKRTAGSGWQGTLYYTTAGHGESDSFRKTISEPVYDADGYAVCEWDMSALTVGGSDWTGSTITGIRIDLGNASGSNFDIDWIDVIATTGTWALNDRLSGKTYIVITLDLIETRFQGGPPGITAEISGRKVYDPRKDSTVSGGSGAHRANDTTTWQWTDNAALAARDYLQAEWGFANDPADIDEAYTIAAANACDARASAAVQAHAQAFTASASADTITFAADEIYSVGDGVRLTTTSALPGGLSAGVTYYVIRLTDAKTFKLATSVANAYAGTAINITSAGTGTHTCTWHDYATYKANGAFLTEGGQKEAILDDLVTAMAGDAVYGAQWQLIAGAWTAPVMSLVDDDLVGQIEIVQSDTPLDQLINGVRGTLIPFGKGTPTEYDTYTNSTFVANDGQELWADLPLEYTDSRVRARNLARILVETSRNGQIIRYPAKLKAWPLQVGDRVTVTSAEYGFSAKTYRVTDWQFGLTSPVVLTLQEDTAAAWDLADAATADQTQNTGLSSPWVVQQLTGVLASSGLDTGLQATDGSWQPRVRITWDAVTGPYLTDGTGKIIVKWRDQRGDEWLETEVPGSDIGAWLIGIQEGDALTIAVAARNGLGQLGPPVFLYHYVTLTHGVGTLAPRGNLLDSRSWTVGTSDTQGVSGGGLFTHESSSAAENAIVLDTAPDGELRPIWRATSADAAAGDRDGGFRTGEVPVDPSKIYRWAVWTRVVSGTSGLIYLGLGGVGWGNPNSAAVISTGAAESNPYVINGYNRTAANFAPGRWYLLVGYVLPSTFGTTPPSPTMGGVYDGATGQRVAGASFDYKWLSTATVSTMRAFQNAASSGSVQDFWGPRIEMCDGTEPTLDQLLSVAKPSLGATLQPDFESQFGLNGQFSQWLLGASLPDGWSSIGGTNSRETTITRTGPNAVRSVSAGASAGIRKTVDLAGLPLAAGSFVEGTLDAYLVSHSSGGYPGLRITLYANSGLTTERHTIVNLPNTTTGGWQSMQFKAAVNSGERIYGVRFDLLSSLSTLSGGDGTNTVVFDSLVARAVQPSDVAHLANAVIALIADAQATADGKIDSFFQSTAPGTANEGDIWFDTDDSNRQYRRTSGAWVLAADTRIGTAITNAATAQATADGKIVTFVQASTPSATSVGDLWFDSDDGYKLYRAGAPGTGSWTAYQLGTAAIAANAATQVHESAIVAGPVSVGSGGGLTTVTVASVTFTPDVSGTVIVTCTFNAQGNAFFSSSLGYRAFLTQSTTTTGDFYKIGTDRLAFTVTASFAVVAGVSVTCGLFGQASTFGTTGNFWDAKVRAEHIKR